MSQKKRKKRKPQTANATQNPMELQETEKYKRFDPAARNLLWLDLIFLAVAQIMANKGVISNTMSDAAGIIGAILLFVALYLQFKPKHKNPKPPRL